MNTEQVIIAKPRNVFGKAVRKTRKAGMLPAVLYGKGQDSLSIEVSGKEFEKVFRRAGENTLVRLQIEGQGEKRVLIHDVAKHFMKDEIIHVDFYEVDLTKTVKTKVPLHFEGTSPAVKELGGILVKVLNEVEIEALPTDLPSALTVNMESIKGFEDSIRVSDLPVPANVKIITGPDEVVVSVTEPRTEEELASLEQSTAEAEKAAIEGLTADKDKEAAEGEAEVSATKE